VFYECETCCYFGIIRLHRMHEMQIIVTDVRSQSVCHECTEWPQLGFTVRGNRRWRVQYTLHAVCTVCRVIWFSLRQMPLAFCYIENEMVEQNNSKCRFAYTCDVGNNGHVSSNDANNVQCVFSVSAKVWHLNPQQNIRRWYRKRCVLHFLWLIFSLFVKIVT